MKQLFVSSVGLLRFIFIFSFLRIGELISVAFDRQGILVLTKARVRELSHS